ncbi:hypothetical protein AeNC1_012776 [Aphanomyces euteiches]|nr:hypothetical protein AeNC1_012776 [Aphanomyces euteiches]
MHLTSSSHSNYKDEELVATPRYLLRHFSILPLTDAMDEWTERPSLALPRLSSMLQLFHSSFRMERGHDDAATCPADLVARIESLRHLPGPHDVGFESPLPPLEQRRLKALLDMAMRNMTPPPLRFKTNSRYMDNQHLVQRSKASRRRRVKCLPCRFPWC